MIGGIIRGITASKQAKNLQKKADALNPVRPEYEIPQEVRTYLENAYNMAQGDMPGYGRMMDQAQGTTANQVATGQNFADSGSNMLQFLSQTGANERRNVGDINMKNAGFKQGNMNVMNQALMTMGDYQDQKFDVNKMQPYLQEEFDKRNYQEQAINQRMAAADGWGSFADGVVNTGLAVMGAPMGAGGQSMFGKIFGGEGQQASNRIKPAIGSPTRPPLGMPQGKWGGVSYGSGN